MFDESNDDKDKNDDNNWSAGKEYWLERWVLPVLTSALLFTAVWLSLSHFTSLCLCFLTCTMKRLNWIDGFQTGLSGVGRTLRTPRSYLWKWEEMSLRAMRGLLGMACFSWSDWWFHSVQFSKSHQLILCWFVSFSEFNVTIVKFVLNNLTKQPILGNS